MTDKELLELAAKAVQIKGVWDDSNNVFLTIKGDMIGDFWNPLTDDGDALRLAVKLGMSISGYDYNNVVIRQGGYAQVMEPVGNDSLMATRRAIVRAAAEIGKEMK